MSKKKQTLSSLTDKVSDRLMRCSCKHEYQDKRYGPQMRLITRSRPKVGQLQGEPRCTVCTKEHRKSQRLVSHASLWSPAFSLPPTIK